MTLSRFRVPIRLALLLLAVLLWGGVSAMAQDATPVEVSPPSPTPEPPAQVDEPVPTVPDSTIEPTESPTATETSTGVTETPSPPSTPTAAEDGGEPLSVRALAVTLVSPVDPMIVQPDCVDGVVIPQTVTVASTAGITYFVEQNLSPGKSFFVTAVLSSTEFAFAAVSGNWTVIDDYGAIAMFEIDLVPPCEGVVPVPPVVTQARCDGGDITQPSVVIPENTSVISYARAGQVAVGRSVIVTADLERDGDTWVDPLPPGWSRQGDFAVYTVGRMAKAPCVPAPPIVTPASCVDGVAVPASVAAPPDSSAIRYQLQRGPTWALVTATLTSDAVEWASPLPAEWRQLSATQVMFAADGLNGKPCIAANLVSASLFPGMLEGLNVPGESIDLVPILPASPGVSYAISGTASPNTTITVTAELHDGYAWAETLPVGWIAIDEDTAVFEFVIGGDFDYAENPPAVEAPAPLPAEPSTSLVVTRSRRPVQLLEPVRRVPRGFRCSWRPDWRHWAERSADFLVSVDEVTGPTTLSAGPRIAGTGARKR